MDVPYLSIGVNTEVIRMYKPGKQHLIESVLMSSIFVKVSYIVYDLSTSAL